MSFKQIENVHLFCHLEFTSSKHPLKCLQIGRFSIIGMLLYDYNPGTLKASAIKLL